jgi:DedD protein
MAATHTSTERTPDSVEKLRQRANRRLLGAAVLLLIAIIMVPIFLEREPPPLSTQPVEVPAITEPTGAQAAAGLAAAVSAQAVTPSATPATPPAANTPAATAGSAALTTAAKEAPKAAAAAVTKEAPKTAAPSAPSAASATAPAAAPATKPGQLVVQVIAVRDAATALDVLKRAKSLKFPAYTELIDVTNGKVTRVRVGPYDTKQAAETARAKLVQAGFEAKVLTLQ